MHSLRGKECKTIANIIKRKTPEKLDKHSILTMISILKNRFAKKTNGVNKNEFIY
jgi:hypothetical protein